MPPDGETSRGGECPAVDIVLNGQQEACVNTYSTGDKIKGAVLIKIPANVRFDDIIVTFEGARPSLLTLMLY